jgi:hypothetical protein
MRIAVISDIHGNMDALESVLRDIDNIGVDRAFFITSDSHADDWLDIRYDNVGNSGADDTIKVGMSTTTDSGSTAPPGRSRKLSGS